MKKDILLLNKSLSYIQENETNKQLTTTTFYKDICILSNTMNKILERNAQIRISNEKSNREFHQAITNVSHDLRTPLTSAIGYVQMIQSDKTDENKKAEYLEIIERRLKALSNLTGNLLTYTRLIEGVSPMKFEQINVNSILKDIISTFYLKFIEQDYKVTVNISDQPLYVMGDAASFERIFTNLIQNVLLYGKEIFEVSVDTKEGVLEFRNNIAELQGFDVDQILDRFYTSDSSRNNKSLGLGLAIVRELVTSMGGSTSASVIDDTLIIKIKIIRLDNPNK